MEDGVCPEVGFATGNLIGARPATATSSRLVAARRRDPGTPDRPPTTRSPTTRCAGRGGPDVEIAASDNLIVDNAITGAHRGHAAHPVTASWSTAARQHDQDELDSRQPVPGDRAGERCERRPGRSNSWLGVRGRRRRSPSRARTPSRAGPGIPRSTCTRAPVMRVGGRGNDLGRRLQRGLVRRWLSAVHEPGP